MLIEGVEFDLEGLEVMPGLINAHDHMEFALFPRLGKGPYANAAEWARDIYRPDESTIAEQLRIPKRLRLIWGGLRNLIAGVTTVAEHNEYDAVFDRGFPVRVIREYGWAHSLQFGPDVGEKYRAIPLSVPFVIHAGEGTDAEARAELYDLDRAGVLGANTVLVHGVAWGDPEWRLIEERGANVIACPRSNLFTLGRTLNAPHKAALGTDSALTAQSDLLDEICMAQRLWQIDVRAMVTSSASRILRLPDRPEDWIAAPQFGVPPEVVVIGGQLRLISPSFAERLTEELRSQFSELHVDGRPPRLVRHDVPALIAETKRHFDGPIRLAGREVLH